MYEKIGMNRNRISFSLLALVIIVLGGSVIINQSRLKAANILGDPESRDIIAILERAYTLLDIQDEQLDLDDLSKVFVNHPYFAAEVSTTELHALKSYTMKIQGQAALKNFGYLTAIRTKRMNQQNGAQLLRAAQAKAKAENRTLTREEFQQLTEQNYGMEPYVPEESSQEQGKPFQRKLTYYSIVVQGDKAEVRYDTGAKNRKAILVRINGQWYVAGIF